MTSKSAAHHQDGWLASIREVPTFPFFAKVTFTPAIKIAPSLRPGIESIGCAIGNVCCYRPHSPAQQRPHPAPPLQSALVLHSYGSHHLDATPKAFTTQLSIKTSPLGFFAVCFGHETSGSNSHCFTNVRSASPASFCWMALDLHV